jgi:hypothetical protein
MLTRCVLVAVLVLSLTGCARSTPEAKIFRQVSLPGEAKVVATVQGRTGFNIWALRMPAGFPIEKKINFPQGYQQDPNVSMNDGPDCASALVVVSADCKMRPLVVKVGPGGNHGTCTLFLYQLVQPAMTFDQELVKFAQLTIDC